MENLTETQQKAWQCLKLRRKGTEITGRQLGRQIEINDQKGKPGANMRLVIHALRVKGYPICASSKGYYVAYTEKELDDYRAELQGRIQKIQESLYGLADAKPLYEMEVQRLL